MPLPQACLLLLAAALLLRPLAQRVRRAVVFGALAGHLVLPKHALALAALRHHGHPSDVFGGVAVAAAVWRDLPGQLVGSTLSCNELCSSVAAAAASTSSINARSAGAH